MPADLERQLVRFAQAVDGHAPPISVDEIRSRGSVAVDVDRPGRPSSDQVPDHTASCWSEATIGHGKNGESYASLELAPSVGARPSARRRAALIALGAAAAVLVLVLGFVVRTGEEPEPAPPVVTAPVPTTSAPASTVPGLAGFPTVPTTNPPTTAARANVSWWVPTALPGDLSFRYALDWTGHYREMRFGSGDCSPVCDRSVVLTTEVPLQPTGEVVLGGRVWNTTRDPAAIFLRSDDQSVMLTGENLTSEELAEIAAGLRLLPETELPRVPLVCCPYTSPGGVDPGPVVAHVELETAAGVERWDLHAYTDGAQFALSGYNQSDETPGPFYRLSSERPFVLGWRPGYYTNPRLPEGTGLIYGVTHPNVATIDVVLRDGQTITYEPQDESDLFYENFIFLAIPIPDDGEGAEVFSEIVEIIARDGNGNELFRCDSGPSCAGR